MGRKKNETTIEIATNVYLKKSEDSGIYSYYFKVKDVVFRRSTKTTNLTSAKQKTLNDYEEARIKGHIGKIVKKVSFKKLVNAYLESLKGQRKYKYHSETIQRHALPFFKNFDDISKITNGTLNEYLIERRKKANHEVKNQTLNREKGVINQLLQFGSEAEWCNRDLKVKHQSERGAVRRRPHFTALQLIILFNKADERIDELFPGNYTGQERGLVTGHYKNRWFLKDIMTILLSTGMRVDEIKTVRWKDIDFRKSKIKLNNAGKVSSNRELLVRSNGMSALENMRQRRLLYLEKTNQKLDNNELIHSLPSGKYIESLKKGFSSLVADCNFKYEQSEIKHTLTSLRHTYATARLTARKNRASLRALSKQMGTSEKMIEKHYGHDKVEDYRSELLN